MTTQKVTQKTKKKSHCGRKTGMEVVVSLLFWRFCSFYILMRVFSTSGVLAHNLSEH